MIGGFGEQGGIGGVAGQATHGKRGGQKGPGKTPLTTVIQPQ